MKEVMWEGGMPSHEERDRLGKRGRSWMMKEEMKKKRIVMMKMSWMFSKVVMELMGGGRN